MKRKLLYILVLLFADLQTFAQTYTYDNLNRLTKVVYVNGTTVTYTYDALGNRTKKKVTSNSVAEEFTISVTALPVQGGTVSGGGTYASGTVIELLATPNAGYEFVEWSDGVTANPRTVTVTSDMNFTAQFLATGFTTDYAQKVILYMRNNRVYEYGVPELNDISFNDKKMQLTVCKTNNQQDEYSVLLMDSITFVDIPSLLQVTPTEIDFGKVELGTDKTETFTVKNISNSNISFRIPYWGSNIEVSDTNEDITLAHNESKVFTVTAHGMKRGSSAGCEINIELANEEIINVPTINVSFIGWDTHPLTLATNSISLSSGEEKSVDILYGSLNYELTSDNPHLFSANIGGRSQGGGGWYEHYSSTTHFVRVEARATGEQGTLRIRDKDTDEEVTLEVNVDALDTGVTPVDLGLPSGTMWASCNVGANAPEEFGGYYAWGETEEKASYDWSTYIYCDGTSETCHNIGNSINGTKYDVAHERWKWSSSLWMIPSLEQFEELINNCSHEVVSMNNWWEKGIKFTGPNNNSIFMPFTGYRPDTHLYGQEHYGCYWLSTSSSSSDKSYYFTIDESGSITIHSTSRSWGLTVRPISPPDPIGNIWGDL